MASLPGFSSYGSGFCSGPGSKGVLDLSQHRFQGGEMPQQDGGHIVLDHPVEANFRVDSRIVVRGEKPVAIQTARGHHYEDTKSGIAETKPLWRMIAIIFRVHTDHEVNLFNVVVVNAPQFFHPGFITSKIWSSAVERKINSSGKRGCIR